MNISRSIAVRIQKALQELLFSLVKIEFTTKAGCFFRLKDKADFDVIAEIYISGEYDEALANLAWAEVDEIRIVDLGANRGTFAARVCDWCLQEGHVGGLHIICIDANEELLPAVNERLKNVKIPHFSWKVLAGLVGLKKGEAKFLTRIDHLSSKVVDTDIRAKTMRYVDVDALHPEKIDLLKIDIEGSECDFVSSYGDLLRRCDNVVVELHHDLCNCERVKEILVGNGFSNQKTLRQENHISIVCFSRNQL